MCCSFHLISSILVSLLGRMEKTLIVPLFMGIPLTNKGSTCGEDSQLSSQTMTGRGVALATSMKF